MFAAISAFEVKLCLWETKLSKKKPMHFKRLADCNRKDIDFGKCASVFTKLRGEFTSRFEGLCACSSDFPLFTSPFDCVVYCVNSHRLFSHSQHQCSTEKVDQT